MNKLFFTSFLALSLWGCSKPSQESVSVEIKQEKPQQNEKKLEESPDFSQVKEDEIWKDPQTGLIWLKCSVGKELKNGVCSQSSLSGINEQIKLITGSLTSNQAETEFQYSQTEKVITYLNSQHYKGSNKWRLPTIFELSKLRNCANGWNEVVGAVNIRNEKDIISLPTSCIADRIYNVFIKNISPMEPGQSSGIGYWSSTVAIGEEFNNLDVWVVHPTFGDITTVKKDDENGFGQYQNIILVHDN